MSHLRAPADRRSPQQGQLPPLGPQLSRIAVLPPVAVALGGGAAVLYVVLTAGAPAGPVLWAVLAGAVALAVMAVAVAAVAARRAAHSVSSRVEGLLRRAGEQEAELRAAARERGVPDLLDEDDGAADGSADADGLGRLAEELGRAHHLVMAALSRVVSDAPPERPVAEAPSGAGLEQRIEVFVNVARRLQSLAHREIAVLDELEREIEDPDLLKGLFHVDHLATRVRRHAENLAVLGGAASRRQWSEPIPLEEVLRSAVAEVEQYARVRVVPPVEGTLRGHAVADVIHLLAELVENATVFSPPHTQVAIRADAVAAGLAVEVEDRGLGMPSEEQERMNALLADPASVDVAELLADGRIGLYVVSQLARRHGVRVRLGGNIYGGVQAVLVLPRSLLGPRQAELPAAASDAPVDDEPGGETSGSRLGTEHGAAASASEPPRQEREGGGAGTGTGAAGPAEAGSSPDAVRAAWAPAPSARAGSGAGGFGAVAADPTPLLAPPAGPAAASPAGPPAGETFAGPAVRHPAHDVPAERTRHLGAPRTGPVAASAAERGSAGPPAAGTEPGGDGTATGGRETPWGPAGGAPERGEPRVRPDATGTPGAGQPSAAGPEPSAARTGWGAGPVAAEPPHGADDAHGEAEAVGGPGGATASAPWSGDGAAGPAGRDGARTWPAVPGPPHDAPDGEPYAPRAVGEAGGGSLGPSHRADDLRRGPDGDTPRREAPRAVPHGAPAAGPSPRDSVPGAPHEACGAEPRQAAAGQGPPGPVADTPGGHPAPYPHPPVTGSLPEAWRHAAPGPGETVPLLPSPRAAGPAPCAPHRSPLPVRERTGRATPAGALPGSQPADSAPLPAAPADGPAAGVTAPLPRLPRRRAQSHLAPQLRSGPAPRPEPAHEEAGHDPDLMAAFRRGFGLAEACDDGDRPFGDRPFGDRVSDDRLPEDPLSGDRPFGDRVSDDRLPTDPFSGDRPFGDRLSDDRLPTDPFSGDRPVDDRHRDDRHGGGHPGDRHSRSGPAPDRGREDPADRG
ncbi:sensor histidine kinase [Streptomyces abyssomicinicus]|uniref:sensor histidine kinase n=1 Tax=Streptomyces abyssomicinicus TaxID=574929 RepID=UPI001FE4B203|nr:sensor histidine kinase [Streptomyces abyssomicinicus]